jgi:hypothetical protein
VSNLKGGLTVRAILIDPEKQTIKEISLEDDYRRIQQALHCNSFTTGAWLRGSIEKGFDAVYASDDDLKEREQPLFWFQVDADRDPPSSFPIAGLGLAMGIDTEGGGCDCRVSVAELKQRITFTQRKFRGFNVTESRGNEPGTVHIKVEPVAPIIDGASERQRDDE